MDIDDIPSIDPALPTMPEFFDAEDGPGDGDISLPPPPHHSEAVPLLSNVLTSLEGSLGVNSGLKFDDELCEFDEFLVSLEGGSNNAANGSGELEVKEKDKSQSQTSAADSDKTVELNKSQGVSTGLEESPTVNGDNQPKSNASTRSSTPISRAESTAGATVVRLSFPKVSLPSKRISLTRESSDIAKDRDSSPSKVKSPPRMTRGRLNPPEKESRPKRRLSVEDQDEDWAPSSSTTRSGRQSRKPNRYEVDDDEDSDDNNAHNNASPPPPSVAESEHSELFEPVRKKRKRTSHWTDDDGTTFFVNGFGSTTTLRKCYVHLVRVDSAKGADNSFQHVSEEDLSGPSPILLEVCIDNIMSAREAVIGGAKRLELCASLSEGGLTPSCGFLQVVKENFKDIPVFVMIRPRGGDFLYDADEIEIMNRDISYYKQSGADGFVFGALTKDSQIDVANCKLLLQSAYPLPCTFHRAFDKVSDPYTALETIIHLGFKRILTSGLQVSAHAGVPTIKRLMEAAKSRIVIMPGCGIDDKNVADIVKRTGAKEIHGSASKSVASLMSIPGPSKSSKRGGKAKQSGVKMGSTDDSVIKVTDSKMVAQMVRKARQAAK